VTGSPHGRRPLHMDLGYQVHDVVTKKNFRTHQGRDQENVLVKQSKDRKIVHTQTRVRTHLITSAMSALTPGVFIEKKRVGGLA
jgi:hypothetical protein